MKAKDLAALLLQYPDAEVSITDGYRHLFYHTDKLIVAEWEPGKLDIGIGDCVDSERPQEDSSL